MKSITVHLCICSETNTYACGAEGTLPNVTNTYDFACLFFRRQGTFGVWHKPCVACVKADKKANPWFWRDLYGAYKNPKVQYIDAFPHRRN